MIRFQCASKADLSCRSLLTNAAMRLASGSSCCSKKMEMSEVSTSRIVIGTELSILQFLPLASALPERLRSRLRHALPGAYSLEVALSGCCLKRISSHSLFLRQRNPQIKRLVNNPIQHLHFTHRHSPFRCDAVPHIPRLHRLRWYQFKIVRPDHFLLRPDVIRGKIFPAQVKIKKALAREILAVAGRQHFHFIFNFTFERIPPRPARAELNPKCAAALVLTQVHRDLGMLPFVPAERVA